MRNVNTALQSTVAQEKPLKHLNQIIRERRSTPSFDGSEMPSADLHQILEAGIAAPSGYNVQPWRFVAVQSQDQKRRLRMACFNQAKAEEASVVIACCGDADSWRRDADDIVRMGLDGGMPEGYATQLKGYVESYLSTLNRDQMHGWLNKQVTIASTFMLLMAESLGYNTAVMEGFEQERVRETLRLPLSYWVVSLLAIGRRNGPEKYHGGRFGLGHLAFGEEFGKPLK